MSKKTETKEWANIDSIIANPDQPRTHFDQEELERLAVSLKQKQNQPVTVIPFEGRYMIVDGERRWRAAKLAGLKRLWVVVDDDVTNAEELHSASFTANWCRAGHTHEETARAIELETQRGRTYEEIGAMVGKSEDWARKEHSLLLLAPEVMALLNPPTPKNERIPLAVAYLLTQYPAHKQMGLWNKHRARGREAFHHIRTSAAPTVDRRRPVDDAKYIVGRVRAAEGAITGVLALPGRMLGGLPVGQREAVSRALRNMAARATEMADLVDAAGAVGGEEE
jgi:ParB family chromosome partitioning protein